MSYAPVSYDNKPHRYHQIDDNQIFYVLCPLATVLHYLYADMASKTIFLKNALQPYVYVEIFGR